MPVIHIVLIKVKQAVLTNGFDELKQKCETLKDLPIAKAKATELKWGPPAYPGRNEGYNWGKYIGRSIFGICDAGKEHAFSLTVTLALALLSRIAHINATVRPTPQVSTACLPLGKTTRPTGTTRSTASE